MPEGGGGPRVALVTHPREGAEQFARSLVERRLAACVNTVGVSSSYRWKGGVEVDDEVLLIVKTAEERIAELEAELAERHPYDVPELIVLDPEKVEARYRTWLLAAVARDE